MRREHELMHDMLGRAKMHLDVPSPECQKTGAMLRLAVHVMSDWDCKITRLEAALQRIRDCDFVITLPDRMDAVRAIAREALEL